MNDLVARVIIFFASTDDLKIPIGPGGEDATSVDIPRVSASQSTVDDVMGAVYFWAGTVAVIVLVVAGFFYVTANGDAKRIQVAKNAILGAIIGLIVILMAFIITQIVIGTAT